MLRTIHQTRKGTEILECWEFFNKEAADGQNREYVIWLRHQHLQQVLGEVVSNSFTLLIKFILQQYGEMARADTSETKEQGEDGEDEAVSRLASGLLWMGLSSRYRGNSNTRSLKSDEIVCQWAWGCIVCRVRGHD
jgi:hypothetical protein